MDKDPLYALLRSWRSEKADELETELYTIVPNKTLKAIAKEKPVTLRVLKEGFFDLDKGTIDCN